MYYIFIFDSISIRIIFWCRVDNPLSKDHEYIYWPHAKYSSPEPYNTTKDCLRKGNVLKYRNFLDLTRNSTVFKKLSSFISTGIPVTSSPSWITWPYTRDSCCKSRTVKHLHVFMYSNILSSGIYWFCRIIILEPNHLNMNMLIFKSTNKVKQYYHFKILFVSFLLSLLTFVLCTRHWAQLPSFWKID